METSELLRQMVSGSKAGFLPFFVVFYTPDSFSCAILSTKAELRPAQQIQELSENPLTAFHLLVTGSKLKLPPFQGCWWCMFISFQIDNLHFLVVYLKPYQTQISCSIVVFSRATFPLVILLD